MVSTNDLRVAPAHGVTHGATRALDQRLKLLNAVASPLPSDTNEPRKRNDDGQKCLAGARDGVTVAHTPHKFHDSSIRPYQSCSYDESTY